MLTKGTNSESWHMKCVTVGWEREKFRQRSLRARNRTGSKEALQQKKRFGSQWITSSTTSRGEITAKIARSSVRSQPCSPCSQPGGARLERLQFSTSGTAFDKERLGQNRAEERSLRPGQLIFRFVLCEASLSKPEQLGRTLSIAQSVTVPQAERGGAAKESLLLWAVEQNRASRRAGGSARCGVWG